MKKYCNFFDLGNKCLVVSIVDSKHKNGGIIYTNSIIKTLNANCNATILWSYTRKEYNSFWLKLYSVLNFVISIFSLYPAKVIAYFSPLHIIKTLAIIYVKNINTVVLDHDELFWMQSIIPKSKRIIFITHNDEVDIYQQRIDSLGLNFLLNLFLQYDVKKFKRYCNNTYNKLKNVITISLIEKDRIKCLYPTVEVIYIPPRFRIEKNSNYFLSKKEYLFFVGDLRWRPNFNGLNWFIVNVLPYLNPVIRLWCVGNKAADLKEAGDRVEYIGYIDSLNDVWGTAKLMIAPIFDGSGANVKLAEYLAHGMPVITTNFCARPYGLHQSDCFISDDADEWVRYINEVFQGHEPVSPSSKLIDQFSICCHESVAP